MAGIYLHIPFCKQACHYCDFHFSTLLKNKQELLEAMNKEIRLRADYLQGEKINTIYFGGGTPSLLDTDELKRIFDLLYAEFEVDTLAEITLEANPDDLSRSKVLELKNTQVNRLSIGIQSFREEDLQMMNRAHTSSQSDYSVKAAQDQGFENITVDLIYSIPGMEMKDWKKNLQKTIDLHVQHISAYSLTIEPATVFGNYEKRGKLLAVDQEVSSDQFLKMLDTLRAADFEQYEVSNFCRPGYESRHNSAYWKREKYIGIGPSAHSFDGKSRQWNVSNNSLYVRSLEKNVLNFEREELDERTLLNEYFMTGLRTKWGINPEKIRKEFNFDLMSEYREMIEDWISSDNIKWMDESLVLTDKGMLKADRMASDLFIMEEKK